jgi:hypothetical protein
MIIMIQLLAALAGILMYALCANPKLAEIGRILFFAGILTFLLNASQVISILPRH